MKNKFLFRLLDVIEKNGDVRRLIHEGIDFKTIGDLTQFSLQHGYVVFIDKKIVITQKGIDEIKTGEKEYKRTNKAEWILPDWKSKITKIDKNDIFLPRKDDLEFIN